ncbi:MAG: S1 RNA-binding domain-containing protein [Patescibacteria group bacterium]|nr:S1 RNA-binding domain-containing protein [Patescibacteria group bacterium]
MNNDDFDITEEIDEVLSSSSESEKEEVVAEGEGSSEHEYTEEKPLMQKLLNEFPAKIPNEGEKISGKVISIEAYATYLDLGTLGAGIVYGKEIKDGFGIDRKKLGVGDEVVAVIQDLENEDGYVELSIREAVREEAWQDIQKRKEDKTPIETRIVDANKGGLMLEINGITGFMPVSQLTAEHYPRVEDGDKNKILEILRTYIGTEMQVCVIDIDSEEEKLIVSEKEANRDKEKTAIAELKVGDIVEGDVSGVVDFGAFVKFFSPSKKKSDQEEDKLEGLVHISQLDWQLIDDPRKIVKVGDRVRAKIISIDDTRISLSIRELKNDPWVLAGKKYKVGDQVLGKVHKINHFGAFVYLDKDIHGLAHVSGFGEYPQKGIDEIVKTGDEYSWEIMSMEPNEHRMGLRFIGNPSKVKKKVEEKKDEVDEKKEEKKEAKKEPKKKTIKKTVAKKETKKVTKKPAAKKTVNKEVKKEVKKVTKKKAVKMATKKEVKKKVAKKPATKKKTTKKASATKK